MNYYILVLWIHQKDCTQAFLLSNDIKVDDAFHSTPVIFLSLLTHAYQCSLLMQHEQVRMPITHIENTI